METAMEHTNKLASGIAIAFIILAAICIYYAVMTEKRKERAVLLATGFFFAMNVLSFDAVTVIVQYK